MQKNRQAGFPVLLALPKTSNSLALAVAFVCALSSHATNATAEPTRVLTPSRIITDAGSERRFEGPVYILPEKDYNALDIELKRAQNAETRLKAENESLKESLDNQMPAVLGVLVGVLSGFGIAKAVDKL